MIHFFKYIILYTCLISKLWTVCSQHFTCYEFGISAAFRPWWKLKEKFLTLYSVPYAASEKRLKIQTYISPLSIPCVHKGYYSGELASINIQEGLILTQSESSSSSSHDSEHIRREVVMVMSEHEVSCPRANVPHWDIGNLQEMIGNVLKAARLGLVGL